MPCQHELTALYMYMYIALLPRQFTSVVLQTAGTAVNDEHRVTTRYCSPSI